MKKIWKRLMLGDKIISFLLWFKKKHYREVMIDGCQTFQGSYLFNQVYKNLFGRKYILALNAKPPEHVNWRGDSLVCLHIKTQFESWPDGGVIEVCDDCGMSRYHWEQGESPWIMIEDIPGARKELEEQLEGIRKNIKFEEGGRLDM